MYVYVCVCVCVCVRLYKNAQFRLASPKIPIKIIHNYHLILNFENGPYFTVIIFLPAAPHIDKGL